MQQIQPQFFLFVVLKIFGDHKTIEKEKIVVPHSKQNNNPAINPIQNPNQS